MVSGRRGVLAIVSLVFIGCGSSYTGGTKPPGGGSGSGGGGGTDGGVTQTVTIKGFADSPVNLSAPSPSTITWQNQDSVVHTATSQATAGSYQPGAATGGFRFDTGSIAPGASATIAVPAGLASGTVQPYFCSIHKGAMMTPNPTITIR